VLCRRERRIRAETGCASSFYDTALPRAVLDATELQHSISMFVPPLLQESSVLM